MCEGGGVIQLCVLQTGLAGLLHGRTREVTPHGAWSRVIYQAHSRAMLVARPTTTPGADEVLLRWVAAPVPGSGGGRL